MTSTPLSSREVLWVVAALLFGLAPHMARFPLLLSVSFVAAALWRVLGAMQRLPLPDRQHPWLWLAKQIVAIAAFAAVYIAYHGHLGRESGVELLAALLGLKLLEMRNARDYYVVTFLCYFLVVTNFFYSQTLYTAVYMLALVVFITTVLVQFNTPIAYRSSRSMLRLSALMVAQALPLMLICFVLFPRIPGPLWGLPQDAFDGVSGLSNDMRLGEIARLGLSDEIAFRVEFAEQDPRARDLYWRGPVLWTTDGRDWTAGTVGNGPAGLVEPRGPSYRYTVTLEPHRMRWLMGLEMVTRVNTAARHTSDQRLIAPRRLRRRVTYELTSVVDYRVLGLNAEEQRAALALPPGWHPRARELAERWRARAADDREVVAAALAYFAQNEFYYSLTPPPLPNDPVDEFLFDSREGFCEHFASTFVVLMRAAGIPARVVTGYQGGEYNSMADYMVVRQRDAHAWAEVYDAAEGWMRVDPTAAVAPERVSLGFDTVMPRRTSLDGISRDNVAGQFWARLRDSVDAVTYGWNQWVLGYTPAQQQRLLDKLGLEDWHYGDLIITLTVCLAAAVIALAMLLVRSGRRAGDLSQAAWREFCDKLKKCGFDRKPSEPPRAFARRVMLRRADLAAEVSRITQLYTRIRYAAQPGDPQELQKQVRRFSPRNKR